MKLHQHTDVSTSPFVLRVHEEPRLLVPEVHVVAAAPPLPGGAAVGGPRGAGGPWGAWQAGGPGWGPASGRLAAALQQLAHGAGLCDRMAGTRRRYSEHEGRLPDVCGGGEGRSDSKIRAGFWGAAVGARQRGVGLGDVMGPCPLTRGGSGASWTPPHPHPLL